MEEKRKNHTHEGSLTTKDGHMIHLTAVASTQEEAVEAVKLGAEGIGLFTCEALYRKKDHPPTEEDLLGLYTSLADIHAARDAVIRLPDLDWHEWPGHELETNPALGCRGIRLALATPELLRPQLMALLRAGSVHPLRLALPFVSAVREVLRFKEILQDLVRDIERRGLSCDSPVLGLMTDLPAVPAAYDIMACEARFFHVGDQMIKYLMGTDPLNTQSPDPFDPAFLLHCRTLIEKMHQRHKEVAISAKIVHEPAAIPLLIGLGFDELTVPTALIDQTRQLVRQTSYNAARLTTAKTTSFWDPGDARRYCQETLNKARISGRVT